MTRILIGIQARTTSKRLPNKVLMELGGKRMLDHVIDEARHAANFLHRQSKQQHMPISVGVALLCPTNDKALIDLYKKDIEIYTHVDEENVFARYKLAMDETGVDHIVRITADCVFMPSHMISRAIKTQIKEYADYTSNVILRSSPEGWDVEVISRKAMDHLAANINSDYDLEHVTTFLRNDIEKNPEFYKSNFVIRHLLEKVYLGFLKMSIDTMEELIVARKNIDMLINLKKLALKSGGFCA